MVESILERSDVIMGEKMESWWSGVKEVEVLSQVAEEWQACCG